MTDSCDTLVILAPHTRRSHTLFAKNSDRPPLECQPLHQVPRTRHRPGATLRCQYVEIPQVEETLAVLGSRPWWLWGFEHGVNECRVAIGNEALHTREALGEAGLLGMDLIRLGLERGRTAGEAKGVITDLIEQHGQGGSGSVGPARRYNNGFLIADPREAWVLHASGRHWVARRVRDRAAISNLASIQDDWDEASEGIEAYVAERGWWRAASGERLDFRAAFENPEPRFRAEGRYAASCRFLASTPRPDVPDLFRHLRDHYAGGTIHVPGRKDGQPEGWSVCMHPGPGVSATAASLVAELPDDPREPMRLWCSMAPPCTGAFLPVAFEAPLPAALTHGGPDPDPASYWWTMKALQDAVMRDPQRLTPLVQEAWFAWEADALAAPWPDLAARQSARLAEVARKAAELTLKLSGLP